MVKRWLAALNSRSKLAATTRDPHKDPVSEARREFDRAAGLLDRYQRTGELGVLNEVVTSCRHALATIPTGHPDHAWHLNNLGFALRSLFERTGELTALTEAVDVGRAAVAATPTYDPHQPGYLNNLGIALQVLFGRTGELAALTEAVQVGRAAVAATSTDHPHQAMCLSNLGLALQAVFGRTGELAALTEAVDIGRAAVAATPTDHPHQAMCLSNLGIALQVLFERTGELAVLTEAVQVGRAVAATPTDHPHQAMCLNTLGSALQDLFERTGELAALIEAVQVGRAAVAATPTDRPDQAAYLSNLGIALRRLFKRTGELAALIEAVQVGRAAVAATPTDHPDQTGYLTTLANTLLILFKRTGELAALTEAVQVGRAAVAATPTDHPHQAMCLSNLGSALLSLFERTGELAPLIEAVQVGRAAVAATPTDHPDQAAYLSNLGLALRILFERTGELAALTEAVQVGRAALAATPTDDPYQVMRLSNLGLALLSLFERTGELAALTEAVQVGRAALAATPTDHPDQAGRLNNLGIALRILFERTGELAALTEAREAFADAAASPAASLAARITSGRESGHAAMLAEEPQAALAALEAAVELVPQLAPRALSRPDREHSLGRLAGLASEVAAAAVATGRPERAVELLEQTRGLLLGEAIDARSDLTELHHAAPALAAEFDALRERATALEDDAAGSLGLPAQPTAALTDTTLDVMQQDHRRQAAQIGEQRRQLAEQWTALVGRIRATAGWEQFLRPPPITRLHHQASAGPIVVVYVSRWRADALIVTPDPAHPVQVVPLPDLAEAAAYEQANRLLAALSAADGDDVTDRAPAQREVHAVLGWLWDTITGPVLDHLGITGERGSRPRIWWCPVGMLAYLPLHAAGHHTDPADTPAPRTVLDRAVCSYIITLRALEHARAHRHTLRAPAGSSVIIAMPTTPEASDLPGVHDEAQSVARLLGSPLILTGPDATHRAVTTALPRHRIAHFACHGLWDWANPAASRLLLTDHDSAPLTVTALMRLHLADADLAYLSACSTTLTSYTLADEAVHLTAAVHLAGYRQVIGTLWPINDTAAARIATDVYTHLTNGGTQLARTQDSAHALAEATRDLRDDHPALPTRWAAHLHLGP